MIVESTWIEDSKEFFLKHYVDIVAPEMLWRYSLGPKPSNMDRNVLIVEDLDPLDVLKLSEHNDPGFKTLDATAKVSEDQGLKEPEASEDTEVEEASLQMRGSGQARSSSLGDTVLEVVPL